MQSAHNAHYVYMTFRPIEYSMYMSFIEYTMYIVYAEHVQVHRAELSDAYM